MNNEFLNKKKEVLDSLFKKWPDHEKLNLPTSGRDEPTEGFPILEVSQKKPDGTSKKWLSYQEGLKIYGVAGITLRRIMPDEIVVDCDDINTKELIDVLIGFGIEFEHWSTTPDKPHEHSHLRFIVNGMEKQSPSLRKIIKENILRQLQDNKGRIPDLCCAYPCRMVSVEWSKHHKRDEYFQLIKRHEGKQLKLTQAHIDEAKLIEKELGKTKVLSKKPLGIKVKWNCHFIDDIIKKGRKQGGVHRGCMMLGAWCNSRGMPLDEAIEFVREWDKKNDKHEPPEQIPNQVRFAYDNNTTHFSCGWIKRQGFCDRAECDYKDKDFESYKKIAKLPEKFEKQIEHDFKNAIQSFTDHVDMARQFIKVQPIYFDKSKMWWVWDFKERCWVMKDDIDIMNAVDFSLENPSFTIKSTAKQEIIEALKRVGRIHKPKEFPKTWIQFKNKIIDLETDEEFEPTPKYFCTNPIPWEISERTDTPTIDRIFAEWVGEQTAPHLKEIVAYCMFQDYPLHRIFALIGAGSNGKGKFMELIRRFVGEANIISTSLDRLVASRFEISKIYRKLVCIMGETNNKLLERTDLLKRASGGDLLPAEHKGKTPFDFHNYAKIIIGSNSLPPTTDKTYGYYRRWDIIDFPNKFPEDKDILTEIPEEEYHHLTGACVKILKNILKERKFTNEVTPEERMRRYEEKSNPVLVVIAQRFERDLNGAVPFSDFYDEVKKHLEDNSMRIMSSVEVGKIVRSDGYEIKQKKLEGENQKCIIGIKEIGKKVTQVTGVTHNLTSFPRMEKELKNGSNGLLGLPEKKQTGRANNIVISQLERKYKIIKNSKIKKFTTKQLTKKFGLTYREIETARERSLIVEISPGRWVLGGSQDIDPTPEERC